MEQNELGRNSSRRKASADESQGTNLFIPSACLVILYYNQDIVVFRLDFSTLGLDCFLVNSLFWHLWLWATTQLFRSLWNLYTLLLLSCSLWSITNTPFKKCWIMEILNCAWGYTSLKELAYARSWLCTGSFRRLCCLTSEYQIILFIFAVLGWIACVSWRICCFIDQQACTCSVCVLSLPRGIRVLRCAHRDGRCALSSVGAASCLSAPLWAAPLLNDRGIKQGGSQLSLTFVSTGDQLSRCTLFISNMYFLTHVPDTGPFLSALRPHCSKMVIWCCEGNSSVSILVA